MDGIKGWPSNKGEVNMISSYQHLNLHVIQCIANANLKGGCAHFDMCNFHSELIDLDP